MLLLFFSRKAVTHMWYRILVSFNCARVSTSALTASRLLSLLSVSTSEVTPTDRSTMTSRVSVSLAATNALYTSEIHFMRDIEHG